MKFRKATSEDLEELNRISLKSKRHWGYSEAMIESWRTELTLTKVHLSEQNVTVMEGSAHIMGFCAVSYSEGRTEIEHLWLLPEHIGKGFGRKLLEKSISEYIAKDQEIYVTADPNAEAFYQKQGFVTVTYEESVPKGRLLPVMKYASKFTSKSDIE